MQLHALGVENEAAGAGDALLRIRVELWECDWGCALAAWLHGFYHQCHTVEGGWRAAYSGVINLVLVGLTMGVFIDPVKEGQGPTSRPSPDPPPNWQA
jgi:hypothetical protein